MRQKPTQGPWTPLCDEAKGRPRCLVVDSQGNQIAEVNPHRESWNEDAQLIAATPDLLEACKMYLRAMDEYGHPDKTDRLIRAAIKKATGEVV